MRIFLSLLIAFILTALPARAMDIEEVTGQSGVKAWLVEDHKLPLLAINFAFRGGIEQDPTDKQGLATLTTNLLTEGAGPYSADAFQQQLADHSISLRFDSGRDALYGSVKALKTDQDKAVELLHLTLTKAHFDSTAIARLRAQQLAAIRLQFGDPGWQGRVALFQQIFGTHPYSERRLGTTETLAHLTRDDIHDFAARHLARSNLIIAVAGDITPEQLAPLLDRIFGDLPAEPKLAAIPEITWPKQTATILVPREGTQTDLLFAMPGPKRSDSDWYATEIANYILGGGGFSSRLMQDVREKNGLTYGIETGLAPMKYGALIVGNAATDNPKTGKAWSIALDTLHRFYDDGATDKEIGAAKDYLTGSMPLMMTSTDKIATALVDIQLDHLGRDYFDRYDDLIRKVTNDDVKQAIRHWFNPDQITLVMVGKPEGIAPTSTQAQVRQ